MKKRWLLRLGLLAGLALFGFWFALWLTAPEHRITEWHIKQIKKGMTLEEVQAILKAPPGDYMSKPVSDDHRRQLDSACELFRRTMTALWQSEGKEVPNMLDGRAGFKTWSTDRMVLLVWIDSNEEVLDLRWTTIDDDSIIGKIRRWLL